MYMILYFPNILTLPDAELKYFNIEGNTGFSGATTSPTFSLELSVVGFSSRSYAQRPLAGSRRERWGICLSKKSVKIFFINNVFAVLIESWKLNVPRLGWQILFAANSDKFVFLIWFDLECSKNMPSIV